MPRLSDSVVQDFAAGRLSRAHRHFGSHPNAAGTWFRVWAPRADRVSVIGDFNDWNPEADGLRPIGDGMSRCWEGFVRSARAGHRYKYRIERGGRHVDKTDPFARRMEPPAYGGSAIEGLSAVITESSHEWTDHEWMARRRGPRSLGDPVSVYEVHLGSWRRHEDGSMMTYRETAEPLAQYVREMGFTHVELMPVLEHPYYGSWGYQVVGYFAPTSRYGSPDDFRFLVDTLHGAGIGVLLDWVPAHFATDPQGLVTFDGEPLFEYSDHLMRHHPDWGTFVFDYGRPQVRDFLASNALYWLEEFHLDGLRFDAVASMLYRDYSREEWRRNQFGGRENLEAVSLVKRINEEAYASCPDVMMIAEESTSWPGVTKPTYDGGLGFLYKWNMGWMHDTLEFFKQDPVHRGHHYREFTFPLMYAYSENFVLSLSHDETVHGKGSMFGKMPGGPTNSDWQKAANLRLMFGHMFGHPGKKLIFMGSEFGQGREWSHDRGVDWWLVDKPEHGGLQTWIRELNALYARHVCLHCEADGGFEWIDFSDTTASTASYQRIIPGHAVDRLPNGADPSDRLLFVFNFTPIPRSGYPVGAPAAGRWNVVMSSDEERFGGSGSGSSGALETEPSPHHGRADRLVLDLPPLGVLILEEAE